MGLRNVHERLQLQFGEAYGLKVESTEGLGTKIIISFPALRGGQANEH
jgi:two-component system sensor histidine kinase YesM